MPRKLTTGFYKPTRKFKAIYEHIAVMDADNNTLVAVVGPSQDVATNLLETVEISRLFAAAPDLLAALEALLIWDDGNLPGDLIDAARAAIQKARKTS